MDRSREAALADLNAWAQEYGLTLMLRGNTPRGVEAVEEGTVELVMVPLAEHPNDSPEAAFRDFVDGCIWWQP